MTFTYDDCLRPQFTEDIFKALLHNQSLNPFGPEWTGKKRLLDDLENLAQEKDIIVLRFDLRAYKKDYYGYLRKAETLIQQHIPAPSIDATRLPPIADQIPNAQLPALSTILNYPTTILPQKIWLFMDHFDVLLNNEEQVFPFNFFTDLNFIKNQNRFTLCCTSNVSHKGSTLHFPNDPRQVSRTSFLELSPKDIPDLNYQALHQELSRQLHHTKNWQQAYDYQKVHLIQAIQGTKQPLAYLELLVEDYKSARFDAQTPADKRFEQYQQLYKKRYKQHHLKPNVRGNQLSRFLKNIGDWLAKVVKIVINIK